MLGCQVKKLNTDSPTHTELCMGWWQEILQNTQMYDDLSKADIQEVDVVKKEKLLWVDQQDGG